MTLEERQFQLLNRHYTNIEVFKNLRFTVPVTVCTLILGIVAILVANIEKFKSVKYEFWVCAIVVFIAIFGIVALKLIQRQYDIISDNIYYLYTQLGIYGDNFYSKNNDYRHNSSKNAKEIFLLGYTSIILLTVISIIIVILI